MHFFFAGKCKKKRMARPEMEPVNIARKVFWDKIKLLGLRVIH